MGETAGPSSLFPIPHQRLVKRDRNIVIQTLPDIAALELPSSPAPLDWVGMSGIDLPMDIREPGYQRSLVAIVDVEVNLPRGDVKGIHMSRLHQKIDEIGDDEPLSPGKLRALLPALIESHNDCGSTEARIRIRFDLLVRRQALETTDLGGWRAYPVVIDAFCGAEGVRLRSKVQVEYSSTCPCSASLARQLIERAFRHDFGAVDTVSVEDVSSWILENATIATPHSQRSEAWVGVAVKENAKDFGLIELIDRVEAALMTPVQTAVKRIDEQAFASRNGQNLMFVEDAARRVREALAPCYTDVDVNIAHLESLHPHDAIASVVF